MVPRSHGFVITVSFLYLARGDESLVLCSSPKPTVGLGLGEGFTGYTISFVDVYEIRCKEVGFCYAKTWYFITHAGIRWQEGYVNCLK